MSVTVLVDPGFDQGVGYAKINPMADFDATYTWNGANLTQVVITGLGKTKTITYSWTGPVLDSMAVTIT
jgi:hypothetical protein